MPETRVISWDKFLSLASEKRRVDQTTAIMKTSLVWLLFLSSSLIIRLSGTENITTGQELQEVDDGGESHVENITIELSVEPLPQAQPLVGTYPHDFQLLPSITRRSSFQERSEGHNFEEQGE